MGARDASEPKSKWTGVSTPMPPSQDITLSPWVPWGKANLLLNCEGLLEQLRYCLLSPLLPLRITFPQSPCPGPFSCFLLVFLMLQILSPLTPCAFHFPMGQTVLHSLCCFSLVNLQLTYKPLQWQVTEKISLRNGWFHNKPLEIGPLSLRRHILIAYIMHFYRYSAIEYTGSF